MDRGGGHPEIRHQRAELRPLQNLRHQRPESEHHLGSAGRQRRAELPEHVMTNGSSGHDAATSRFSSLLLCVAGGVLAGPAQKGHSWLNLGGFARESRPIRLIGASTAVSYTHLTLPTNRE